MDPVSSSLTQNSGALAAATGAGGDSSGQLNAVDFQNFLTLLTTQLQNQDPLNPLDSADFVAQLASFSSVEQLVVANDRLDSIASAITGSGIDQYANWIGREAEAKASPAYFNGDPIKFRLSGETGATQVEALITDQSGAVVATLSPQNTSQVQQWDGLINGEPAPPGVYTITASYYNDGELVSTETANTFGIVKEVRLAGGDGDTVIALDGGVTLDPATVVGLRQPD